MSEYDGDDSPPPGSPPQEAVSGLQSPKGEKKEEVREQEPRKEEVVPEAVEPAAAAAPPVDVSPVPQPPVETSGHPTSSGKRVSFREEEDLINMNFGTAPLPLPEPVDEEIENLPINERLYRKGIQLQKKRDEKHREFSEAKEKAVDEQCTFKPVTSKHAQEIVRPEFLKHNEDIVKRRKLFFEKKAEKFTAEREATATEAFHLTPKTEKLVQKMKEEHRYVNSIKGWDQHFANFLLGPQRASGDPTSTARERSRVAAGLDRKQWTGEERFHPFISPHATAAATSSTNRRKRENDSVFSDLYNDFVMREAANRILQEAQEETLAPSMFRPVTNHGNPVTESHIDSSVEFDRVPRTPRQLAEDLLQKGKEYEKHREQLREKIEEENRCQFKPQIDGNSKRLVRQWNSQNPLYQHSQGLSAFRQSAEARQQLHGKHNRPVPKMKGIPITRAPPAFDVDAFYTRVQKEQEMKKKSIERMRRMKELEEVEDCTFRPSIAKASVDLSKKWAGVPQSTSATRARTPPAAGATTGNRGHREAPKASPVSSSEHHRRAQGNAGFFDADGQQADMYIETLEQELQDVLHDWKNVSDL